MSGAEARARRLTALVLESLGTDDFDTLCLREGISPEELVGLREAFVCAGAARMLERLRPSAWHQVGLTFDGLGLQRAMLVTGPFPGRIRSWLDDGTIDRFAFLNKPPGMRLRFRAPGGGFRGELAASLDELVRSGEISGWTRGFYDAEVHQFGGEVGLDIAHAFFTAESLAVLEHRRLELTGGAALSSTELSLLLLHDFFWRIVEDRWELWDLWSNMALADRVPVFDGADLERACELADRARDAILEVVAGDRGALVSRASAAERALVQDYSARTGPIAERLLAARDSGALSHGPRKLLPFWVIFHWNRMGFEAEDQRRLVFMILRALDPKRAAGSP